MFLSLSLSLSLSCSLFGKTNCGHRKYLPLCDLCVPGFAGLVSRWNCIGGEGFDDAVGWCCSLMDSIFDYTESGSIFREPIVGSARHFCGAAFNWGEGVGLRGYVFFDALPRTPPPRLIGFARRAFG